MEGYRYLGKIHNLPLIGTLCLMVVILIGCGSGNEDLNDGEETGDQYTENEEEVLEVEHAMGSTEIEGTPERVVTLYQGATDTAVALGIEPVGIVESWLEQPIYNYLSDNLEGASIVGDEIQPNLEEVASLEPDLIIATLSRHEEVYDQLSEIAPTIITDPSNEFKYTLDIMGQATNQEDAADQLLLDWEDRVADFQEKMAEEYDEWPMTTSVLNFRSDQIRLFTGGFPGGILDELGFAHTEIQQEAIDNDEVFLEFTNTESIPEMDAEVFFVFMQGNQDEADLEDSWGTWTEHPLWNDLDAVENDQVHMVDEITWNMGGGYVAANEMLDQLYEVFELESE